MSTTMDIDKCCEWMRAAKKACEAGNWRTFQQLEGDAKEAFKPFGDAGSKTVRAMAAAVFHQQLSHLRSGFIDQEKNARMRSLADDLMARSEAEAAI